MRPIGRIFAAAAVGSMALGLAACTTSTDSSSSSDAKPSASSGSAKVDTSGDAQDWEKAAVKGDGTKTIYLVSKGFQHRFWQAVKEGAEQAGEELNYQVKFVGPQDETKVTEQTDQLKSALDSGPAAIGFAALDSKAAADLLKVTPGEVVKRVEDNLATIKQFEDAEKKAKAASVAAMVDEALAGVIDAGYPVCVARFDGLDAEGLRSEWDLVRGKLSAPGACVFASVNESGAPILLAAGSDEAVEAGFNAGKVIKTISHAIKGGGGGRPQMAQAGGKDAAGIDVALKLARELFTAGN